MSIFFHHKHLILYVNSRLEQRGAYEERWRGGENVDCYVESRGYKFKPN